MNKTQKWQLTQRLATLTAKRYELQSRLDNPDIADEAIEPLERKLRSLDIEIGLIRTQIDYYPKATKKRGRPRKERQVVTVEAMPTGSGLLLSRERNTGAKPYKTHVQNPPEPIIRAVIADLYMRLNREGVDETERAEIEADLIYWQECLSEVTL